MTKMHCGPNFNIVGRWLNEFKISLNHQISSFYIKIHIPKHFSQV